MTESHTLRRYRAPSIVRALNPLVRRLIRAGLPLGPNVTLTVRGRSSGLPRTFPVAILDVVGRRFIQSPYGEVNWVQNLRANPEAVITKGRRREPVEALEVTPEDAVAILRVGLDRYLRLPLLRPVVRLFTGVRPDSTDDEMREHVRQHPMFELRTSTGQRRRSGCSKRSSAAWGGARRDRAPGLLAADQTRPVHQFDRRRDELATNDSI